MRCYCVYIMASRSRVLYAGVTNDIVRRVDEHKRGLIPGFTRKYHVTRLVYFERFAEVRAAIAREKEIKEFHPVLFSRRAAACHPERARGTRASEGPAVLARLRRTQVLRTWGKAGPSRLRRSG